MIYQQGDVILESVEEIRGERISSYTLAEGESTGHVHVISDEDVEIYERGGVLYVSVVGESAKITHPEHGILTIPAGY